MNPLVFPIKTDPLTPAQFARAWNANHEGTDIFAPLGAEVQAVADGKIRHAVEETGGKVVYLVEPDGTQYFYGHLDQFVAPRLGPGETRAVKAGQAIGYVGTSGNAKGTAPHVHFEVRPMGGGKVDPFQMLSLLQSQPGGGARPLLSSSGGDAVLLLGLLFLLTRRS
jgi:murein DD-endopeptidase MepM/ murein hydrolase activator NlpD